MPKEFAIKWLEKITKDFLNPKEALMEFQVIQNKLNLSYSVSNIDLERKNKPEKKGDTQNEKTKSLSNSKQHQKTNAIPPINDFSEFKKWLLNKLTELEKIV